MDFKAAFNKWNKKLGESGLYKAVPGKKNYYVLEMFPYPSGSGLHMGHAFNYTIGDIFARLKRMQGYNVLYPMGFDSFGLPAENAAIQNKSHPKKFTEDAIKNYITQMKGLGLTYDWEKTLQTHRPDYYKWDQWIFLKMLEKGLAYKKKASVNWCEKCQTVLANEQVNDGKCWRHEDTNVQTKHLEQWYLKTTAYAEELYDGIENLKEWPELIKNMQRNWIGKSHGTIIKFKIKDELWEVFTTRPDTLYGVTFMVVSAQHSKLDELTTKENKKALDEFRKEIHSVKQEDIDKLDKKGVFTGSFAEHPLTKEKIPIYAGNFVLADYGSGMVMAVPAHDQRDFEFAKKYELPIKQVVSKNGKEISLNQAYTNEGILINSEEFNGLQSSQAKEKITLKLKQEKLGSKTVNYKLRDWLISRQRFWGTPIPIIYCEKCGAVPVAEKDIPVQLPEDIKFESAENPLKKNDAWINASCPKCKGPGKRETDTMDTFVNSSWYYLRYTDPKNEEKIFDSKTANQWCPVNLYIGGKEHACMHLIYIRFYTKFFRDLGLLNFDEPAIKLFNQGMLHAEDGAKMSKSLGNVVLPETIYEKHGLDPARFFLVSIASPDKDINWNDKGLDGSVKFLQKLSKTILDIKIGKSDKKTKSKIHKAIKEITEHYENLDYNLVIVTFRILAEKLGKEIGKEEIKAIIKLITPITPHLAEELWHKIGFEGLVGQSSWPKHKEEYIDYKLEYLEEVYHGLRQDIQDLQKLLKSQPKTVKVLIADEWKYDLAKKYKEITKETRDQKQIISKIMQSELGKKGQDAMKLLQTYQKNSSRIPKQELTQNDEFEYLQSFKKDLEVEFKAKIFIEIKSQDLKVKNALPGKPALIFD